MKFYTAIKELREFLLLWGSQAVSALGTAMTEYALAIWAYEKEGTASSVTLLTICIFLPTILFRFVGGALADRVFEPFMAAESPLPRALAPIFGTGKGAGIALIFCIVGLLGAALSLACLTRPVFRHEERPPGLR